MSYLKPDFNYKPFSLFKTDNKEDTEQHKLEVLVSNKQALISELNKFIVELPDEEMVKFHNNCAIASRMSLNVFDSISMLERFIDGYIASIQKTFPHITEEQLSQIREISYSLKKCVAELLKDGNIENKFLLSLVTGLLSGLLNYENY